MLAKELICKLFFNSLWPQRAYYTADNVMFSQEIWQTVIVTQSSLSPNTGPAFHIPTLDTVFQEDNEWQKEADQLTNT